MEKLIAKCKMASTELLKQSAHGLLDRFEDGACLAFVAVMNELEQRMSKSDYTEFCDAL